MQDAWKYLGVLIPIEFSTFSYKNLKAVNSEVKRILKEWNDKNMFWFERISAVKSFIFPKYLFLFWTAPLSITQSLLNSWQSSLTDFMWSFKRPKLSRQLLTATRASGGLAVPNLPLYYDATVLSTLLKHCNPEYKADWKTIQDNAFHGRPFSEKCGSLARLDPQSKPQPHCAWYH